jgi:hypothetical protein
MGRSSSLWNGFGLESKLTLYVSPEESQETNFDELITVYYVIILCVYIVDRFHAGLSSPTPSAWGVRARRGAVWAPIARHAHRLQVLLPLHALGVAKRLRRHHLRQQLRRAVRYPA